MARRWLSLSAVDAAGVPRDMLSLIAGGAAAQAAVKTAAAKAPASARLALAAIKPALPIARPSKFVCVGLNYAEHAKEGGHAIPTYPSFFLRVDTSLVPAGAPVVLPKCSIQLDYECELTIVIGKGGRHISEARALEHVFGYTLFNDVSVRDYQRKTSQWTAGKNFDGTGPLGPHIVTADELPPGASGLRITTRVNGETMQELHDGRYDLFHGTDHRHPFRNHDARAGRHDRHRHAVGRRACEEAAGVDEGRGYRRGGGRAYRGAEKSGYCGELALSVDSGWELGRSRSLGVIAKFRARIISLPH